MKIQSKQILQELTDLTQFHWQKAQEWRELPLEELHKRPVNGGWNLLECLEHLNYYGNFYLPEIELKMKQSNLSAQDEFRSGCLGNYFAKMMLPKEKGGKMKTFQEMNPLGKSLDKSVLDEFIVQQEKMLELLKFAQTKNLTKIKTSISISKWIKLRLGDSFRVVIYHNKRHVQQAEKALFG